MKMGFKIPYDIWELVGFPMHLLVMFSALVAGKAIDKSLYHLGFPVMVFIICLWGFVFFRRNRRVLEFRLYINEECYSYLRRHPDEESAYKWFWPHVASYEKMLWSFRPLKMERWFSQELIDKLYA